MLWWLLFSLRTLQIVVKLDHIANCNVPVAKGSPSAGVAIWCCASTSSAVPRCCWQLPQAGQQAIRNLCRQSTARWSAWDALQLFGAACCSQEQVAQTGQKGLGTSPFGVHCYRCLQDHLRKVSAVTTQHREGSAGPRQQRRRGAGEDLEDLLHSRSGCVRMVAQEPHSSQSTQSTFTKSSRCNGHSRFTGAILSRNQGKEAANHKQPQRYVVSQRSSSTFGTKRPSIFGFAGNTAVQQDEELVQGRLARCAIVATSCTIVIVRGSTRV
mmetsp:Transcript_4756/g.7950  ORF Transcript_4756/g.7950 Transcript_4756/m.7950 type:complete len:269 (-) Transcript_4756:12-818(-)